MRKALAVLAAAGGLAVGIAATANTASAQDYWNGGWHVGGDFYQPTDYGYGYGYLDNYASPVGYSTIGMVAAPMQTVQLLGGSDGRREFLRRAHAHLRPGGALVCAIATEIEPFDCDAGDVGPSPEIVRVGGVSYISRATRVRVGRRVVRIERERAVLASLGRTAPERPAWARDVVELNQVSVSQLEREGREAGLTASGTRAIAATDEHTASVAVIFGA